MSANGALATVPIVVVSEHEMIGWAIGYSLRSEGLDARFQQSRSAGGVLDSLGRVRAGIALLDLDLERDDPGDRVDGVELVAPLGAAGWRILVLTGSADAGRLGAAPAAGAFGWVPKNAPFLTLLVAIREALSGRSTTSPSRPPQVAVRADPRGHLRHPSRAGQPCLVAPVPVSGSSG